MKKNKSRAAKPISVSPTTREKLPKIYSPTSKGTVSNLSNVSSLNYPPTARSISSNLDTSSYTQPTKFHYKSQKPNKNKQMKNIQQIMIEFVPDKFYVNENSQINFMAYPVIPTFSIPATFPNINLN